MCSVAALPFLLFSCSVMAQSTDKKLVLKNTTDTLSELTVYLPNAKAATGRAVVCCPGGGYTHLAMEHEGHNWAEYFNAQGIDLVVLKYRMPNGDRNIPLSDAYSAIRMVRDNAKDWHVNPNDVGIMGSSAGGHLASAVSTHADEAVRPNFTILFYPVIINIFPLDEVYIIDDRCKRRLDIVRNVRDQVSLHLLILHAGADCLINTFTN